MNTAVMGERKLAAVGWTGRGSVMVRDEPHPSGKPQDERVVVEVLWSETDATDSSPMVRRL